MLPTLVILTRHMLRKGGGLVRPYSSFAKYALESSKGTESLPLPLVAPIGQRFLMSIPLITIIGVQVTCTQLHSIGVTWTFTFCSHVGTTWLPNLRYPLAQVAKTLWSPNCSRLTVVLALFNMLMPFLCISTPCWRYFGSDRGQ